MADVTPSVFRVVQSYGGLKEAYIEVSEMDSDDVIVLEDNNVADVKEVVLFEEDDTTGRALLSFAVDDYDPENVSPTYGNELTLKTAEKTDIKVSGHIKWMVH